MIIQLLKMAVEWYSGNVPHCTSVLVGVLTDLENIGLHSGKFCLSVELNGLEQVIAVLWLGGIIVNQHCGLDLNCLLLTRCTHTEREQRYIKKFA